MKFCTNCGKELYDESKFCVVCGTKCIDLPPEPVVEDIPVEEPVIAEEPVITEEPAIAEEPIVIGEPAPKEIPAPKKFCTKCGAELGDTKFCTKCGASVAAAPAQPAMAKGGKKKRSGGKIALICIAGVILLVGIIAGVLALLHYNSPEQTVLRAIEEQNYAQVAMLLEENPDLNESQKLAEAIEARLNQIQLAFDDRTIDLQIAQDEVRQIQQLEIPGTMSTAQYVYSGNFMLEASHGHFDTAEKAYAEEDYRTAIIGYGQVVDFDQNYGYAQERLASSKEKYRDQLLQNAGALAEQGNYGTALQTLNEGLKQLPDDAALRETIAAYEADYITQQGEDAMYQAQGLVNRHRYLEAIELLTKFYNEQPRTAPVMEEVMAYRSACIDEMHVYTMDRAFYLFDQGNYAQAIRTIEEVTSQYFHEDLNDLKYEVFAAYYAELEEQANELFRAGRYEEALEVYNAVLREFPNMNELYTKRQELLKKIREAG